MVCVCAEANKAAVAAKGGIKAVVASMRRHEGVAGMAEQGCAALMAIAWLGRCSAAVRAHAIGGVVSQCARRAACTHRWGR